MVATKKQQQQKKQQPAASKKKQETAAVAKQAAAAHSQTRHQQGPVRGAQAQLLLRQRPRRLPAEVDDVREVPALRPSAATSEDDQGAPALPRARPPVRRPLRRAEQTISLRIPEEECT